MFLLDEVTSGRCLGLHYLAMNICPSVRALPHCHHWFVINDAADPKFGTAQVTCIARYIHRHSMNRMQRSARSSAQVTCIARYIAIAFRTSTAFPKWLPFPLRLKTLCPTSLPCGDGGAGRPADGNKDDQPPERRQSATTP